VSENNGENGQVQTPAEQAAPDAEPAPAAVAEAVKQAIIEQPPAVQQIKMAPCPCAGGETNLLLDVPQGSKVGRASCSMCGVWGVDFLVPRTQEQELVAKAAAKAWNEAPRG